MFLIIFPGIFLANLSLPPITLPCILCGMEAMKDDKETGRLEGFSDGVIAVAITLLVLGLQPPTVVATSDIDLLQKLLVQWPNYLAFVTSFATIGVMWLNHHRMFTYIRRTDTTLMALNLLLLMVIVFIPFPTALVAQYLKRPDYHTAAAIFNGTYFLLAISFNLLFRYASHENRLMGKEIDQQQMQTMLRQFNIGPLSYLITFALTWVSVPVSLSLNLLLAVFWALPTNKRPSFMGALLPFKAAARRSGTT